ncbi:MAG: hypothetical protein R3C32_11330 [Chloroflexota bacterium]
MDPEPNDDAEHAVVLDPATLAVTGRLSTDADRDRFWADIDRSRTERLTDVTLAWSDGSQRELCIGDGDGATIACGTGVGEVRLRGLMLSAGRYLLSVDGAGGPDDRYRLTVGSSGVEQPAREVEPNDDVTTAHAVSGAFAIGGDLGDGDRDVLAWTVSEADASHAWHLDLSATLGSRAWFALHDPTGTQVADTQTGPAGDGRLWDLRLTPGTWTIEVTPGGGPSPAYVLRATEDTDADIDAEPNGRVARPIDPATLLARGRLAGDGDRDLYSFDLTEAMADTLTTIDLSWPGAGTRSLCLRTGQGSFIQCAEGVGEAVMSSLDLEAGPYALEVSGDPSPSTRYALTVRAGDARSVDAESEPNDAPETADLWDPTLPMHGTARDGDPDVYRVSMPLGVPHRWQLTVLGTGLEAPVWQQPDGASAGTSAVTDDGTMATVEDLLLVGGDHVLTIAADGDYVLTLTDLGEHRPERGDGAQRHPGAGRSARLGRDAARLARDHRRRGRLSLHAGGAEHVRITATPDDRAGGDVASGGVALGEPERDADPRGLIDVAAISTTTPRAGAWGRHPGPRRARRDAATRRSRGLAAHRRARRRRVHAPPRAS